MPVAMVHAPEKLLTPEDEELDRKKTALASNEAVAKRLGLEITLRPSGRARKIALRKPRPVPESLFDRENESRPC